MLSITMIELRLREAKAMRMDLGQVLEASGIQAALDEIAAARPEIDDAQLLPNGTILGNMTEVFIKSYPDVTHPWRATSGRVLSDASINLLIDSLYVAMYRYGSGMDARGDLIQ